MSGIIEPRDGIEVYATEKGIVCIKQIPATGEEAIILIHPDDIPQLIELLEETRQEALHIREDPPGIRNAQQGVNN